MASEVIEILEQRIDLVLQGADVRVHALELAEIARSALSQALLVDGRKLQIMGSERNILGILEIVAAIRRIQTLEGKVPAALAWRLAVALDLPPFAFIATTVFLSAKPRTLCSAAKQYREEPLRTKQSRCTGCASSAAAAALRLRLCASQARPQNRSR